MVVFCSNPFAALKSWAKRIKRDGVTIWFAGKHPRTPWYAKALGLFVVAYALSPIDLIPDFIPVLGYVDDLILLPILIWLTVKLLPPPLAGVVALLRLSCFCASVRDYVERAGAPCIPGLCPPAPFPQCGSGYTEFSGCLSKPSATLCDHSFYFLSLGICPGSG